MTEQFRRPTPQQFTRAVPRQPTDWFGFYRLDDESDERWRRCRIVDISPAGAGLELFDVDPGEPLDGSITISMELRGETRSMMRDAITHTARVGVQFPVPTGAAKEYIDSQGGIQSRW